MDNLRTEYHLDCQFKLKAKTSVGTHMDQCLSIKEGKSSRTFQGSVSYFSKPQVIDVDSQA